MSKRIRNDTFKELGITNNFKKEIPTLKEFLKNLLIQINKIIFKKKYYSVFMNIFEVFISFKKDP